MGSSSKMAAAPAAAAPPPGVVPYGQTSPANIPWDNVLPNPATGDPIRPAQLGDPIWQSGNRMPMAPPPTAAAAPPPGQGDLRALLAMLMSQPQAKGRNFGSSRGGGGIGGNYGTSGGGQSTGSYGRTSSGTRSSAHAGGGKWGGK